jgi:hypothetical protein
MYKIDLGRDMDGVERSRLNHDDRSRPAPFLDGGLGFCLRVG